MITIDGIRQEGKYYTKYADPIDMREQLPEETLVAVGANVPGTAAVTCINGGSGFRYRERYLLFHLADKGLVTDFGISDAKKIVSTFGDDFQDYTVEEINVATSISTTVLGNLFTALSTYAYQCLVISVRYLKDWALMRQSMPV